MSINYTKSSNGFIDIVFDGPPSAKSGRFVETEDYKGASIDPGNWVHRADGYWAYRISTSPEPEISLPTKPGYYADSKGDPWKLADNGYWYDKGYVNGASNRDVDYIKSLAPFVRLEIVDE